jgi:uncharacterized protein YkwD
VALGALCFAFALAAAPAAKAKSCTAQNATPGSISSGKAAKSVFCLLNKERVKRVLPKLARHADLDGPAQDHSLLMVKTKCFEHVCPGEPDLGSRLADYLAQAAGFGHGENIAYGSGDFGSPKVIVRSWMKSKDHRENILNPDFEHVGIGVAWGSPVSARGGATTGTYTTDFGYRDG